MIYLAETRTGVHWIGIDACGNQRPLIADRCEPGVNLYDVFGRDRDQTGLVQIALFEIPEIKRSIVDDGSPKRCAKLRLGYRQFSLGQSIRRIEALIAEKSVNITMKRIRTASCRHVH